jgi:hypothetical protein
VEACADHHPKVKESAKKSLSDISSVIRNPEVSQLAPTLIAALTEPASKTKPALEALLECEFMHSIDAPSLAILIPILTRALKDRGGDLKRKSSIILGNMCSMISDPKIIVPYLGQVLSCSLFTAYVKALHHHLTPCWHPPYLHLFCCVISITVENA